MLQITCMSRCRARNFTRSPQCSHSVIEPASIRRVTARDSHLAGGGLTGFFLVPARFGAALASGALVPAGFFAGAFFLLVFFVLATFVAIDTPSAARAHSLTPGRPQLHPPHHGIRVSSDCRQLGAKAVW